MNQITHWLDGSNIYGSGESTAKLLRLGSRGLLRSEIAPDGGQLLPTDTTTKTKCGKTGSGKCFKAGIFFLADSDTSFHQCYTD